MWPSIAAISGTTFLVLVLGAGLARLFRWDSILAEESANAGEWTLGMLAVSCLAGLLGFLLLVLMLPGLAWAAPAVLVLGAVGCLMPVRGRDVKGSAKPPNASVSGAGWGVDRLLVACVFTLVVLAALQTAWIVAWDARTIWFFHAKMIFTAGRLPLEDLARPELAVTHPDYPMLIPSLGALAAFLVGFWNEILPLAGLTPLVIGEIALVVWATAGRWTPSLLLSWMIVVIPGQYAFISGYADAHVTALALGAGLCLGRWCKKGNEIDLVVALLALGVLASLKNEGIVLAGVLACAAGALCLFGKNRRFHGLASTPALGALALAAASLLAWTALRLGAGLTNDLGEQGAMVRLLSRLNPGDLGLILRGMRTEIVVLCLLLVLVVRWARGSATPTVLLLTSSSVVYFGLLVLVYMSTPHDLAWHLETSAVRVSGPSVVMLVTAAVLSVQGAWRTRSRRTPARQDGTAR